MIQSFLLAWKNAFVFKGKTSRKDFWFFILANTILSITLSITQNLFENLAYTLPLSLSSEIFLFISQTIQIISFFYLLGSLIVSLSIQVRRLNDISKKWVWIFIQIIPILGSIYFIYLMCQPSIAANSQE
ncbi:DUF805 domain-containing protein [uncultured Prochlorococcus sp.]|uniref:DUF805 domain-containing protein n=1 Tax=uncultured Prochlorococcus sp. TaxID=159733 RepID=UPI00258627DB|nr:DUF805 domain-containing protein [uncultured Prochlorococcus sp.]